MKRMVKKIPITTIVLIVINFIVFFVLSMLGQTEDPAFIFEHGGVYAFNIFIDHEYYRLVTALFLHFGFEHLMNNMLVLAVLGETLERNIGHVRFLLIYLISGILANGISVLWDKVTRTFLVSAGASGAVFGIMGALLFVAGIKKDKNVALSGGKVLFLIAFMLYLGLRGEGVDNAAHIGGAVSGFLTGVILCRKTQSEDGVFPFSGKNTDGS